MVGGGGGEGKGGGGAKKLNFTNSVSWLWSEGESAYLYGHLAVLSFGHMLYDFLLKSLPLQPGFY